MATQARPSIFAAFGSAALRPDLSRAARASAAFMIPLVIDSTVGLPVSAVFAAIAAQNVAQLDVRGAYLIRFLLLGAVTLVLAASAALGAAASGLLPLAVAGVVIIALGAALWRHLCPDYALGVIVSTCLLFLLGLGHHYPSQGSAVLGTLTGGAIGLAIQVALWPWRARHPLRQAVGTSWARAADLCALCRAEHDASPDALVRGEYALRQAIDQAKDVLANAGRHHDPTVMEHLQHLNLLAARLAVRAVAIRTALEGSDRRDLARRLVPSLEPLFTSLTNCARSIAISIVSRDAAHLSYCEIRLTRLRTLLDSTRARLAALDAKAAAEPALNEIWSQLEAVADEIPALLGRIVDRSGDGMRFPRELLDLETWQLRPLAASLNLSRRVDPVLVRYALRLACLAAAGTSAWLHFGLPHGYWLPLTLFVVLQPDYGATRARAVQRVAGTIAGSVVAGLLLFVPAPPPLRILGIGLGVFWFAYFAKRRYAPAVFFATIFVVLLLGLHETTSSNLVVERTVITLAAGLAAIAGAAGLWPSDEHLRLRKKLAAAFDASRAYVMHVASRLPSGPGVDEELITSKRLAERAAAAIFASLNNLAADRAHAGETARAASLAHGNQRLLRVANLLLVQAGKGPAALPDAYAPVTGVIERGLAHLTKLHRDVGDASDTARLITDIDTLPAPGANDDGLHRWLLQAANEVRALLAAL